MFNPNTSCWLENWAFTPNLSSQILHPISIITSNQAMDPQIARPKYDPFQQIRLYNQTHSWIFTKKQLIYIKKVFLWEYASIVYLLPTRRYYNLVLEDFQMKP